jgi:hypothetical protein
MGEQKKNEKNNGKIKGMKETIMGGQKGTKEQWEDQKEQKKQ